MNTITTVKSLREAVAIAHADGLTIGLVPTMGALHDGHASLVKRSVSECDITIVSIFVNPTQFNNPTDLATYPRDLDADLRLLEGLGVTYVFAPTPEEVYPEPDTRQFSYPPIDTVMEGARRPGHFNGVCQIVSKLFLWAEPTRAYFGEKDFQQIAVVRAMMRDQGFNFELVPCPIQREESGLALSSRNALLTPEERAIAVNISRILRESLTWGEGVEETRQHVVNEINKIDQLEVEYYEIVDGTTLQSVQEWGTDTVGCITVYCGQRPVRLIDNIRYKAPYSPSL